MTMTTASNWGKKMVGNHRRKFPRQPVRPRCHREADRQTPALPAKLLPANFTLAKIPLCRQPAAGYKITIQQWTPATTAIRLEFCRAWTLLLHVSL